MLVIVATVIRDVWIAHHSQWLWQQWQQWQQRPQRFSAATRND
jgi:hypothetical protein